MTVEVFGPVTNALDMWVSKRTLWLQFAGNASYLPACLRLMRCRLVLAL